MTVRSESPWTLSATVSGPLVELVSGNVIPLDRFQWRASESGAWTPFRAGSTVMLGRKPPSPEGAMLTFDYSVIILPTDAPGRYGTDVEYTVSAAP